MRSVLCVLLAGAAAFGFVTQSRSEAEKEGLTKTALDYLEGWYTADAERMERALHPDLAKRILSPDSRSGKGRIENMSAMTLVQYTRAKKPTPEAERVSKVVILDVFGNAACVRVDAAEWVDYLQLVKTGGAWKIVNVLWELTPEVKQKRGIPSEL